jgi:molybdopterin/thiamine biosynthesis adenylyltransferase
MGFEMSEPKKSIVVVGAGGNTGSHLVPHLARMSCVESVTLIDHDHYEAKNLVTQNIAVRDIGKPKALVQARALKRIRPALRVVAMTEAVETVSLGRLRGDVILACLDSRRARQSVNQAAWQLGVPWIDTGVEGGGLLARVNVYVPGTDNPCLECAWDERDYDLLEQSYSCDGSATITPPTNAPSTLGALAASLAAIECRKLLAGEFDKAAIGKQVLIDALHHRHYMTRYHRNPRCLFDHNVWRIEKLDCDGASLTVGEALQLASDGAVNRDSWLQVRGRPFIKRLTCQSCAQTKSVLQLRGSLSEAKKTCERCGKQMVVAGIDLMERLNIGGLSEAEMARSLKSIGIRAGDIFSVRDGRSEHYFEVC